MGRPAWYLALTFLVLAASACFCSLGSLPDGEVLPPAEEPEPTQGAAMPTIRPPGPPPTATPSGLAPVPTPEVEERIAEVEWPAQMRVGDGEVIRLALMPAPEGVYVAEPEIPGHEVDPDPLTLGVVRPGYTGYAVASLSASGLEAQPAEPERQPLEPGQVNTWHWTIYPREAGTYRPVVSLAVEWVPDAGSDLPGPFKQAVWSRNLTVQAVTTLKLSGKQADWISAAGSALGLVAGLPFTKKALQALWQRAVRSRRRTKQGGQHQTGLEQ